MPDGDKECTYTLPDGTHYDLSSLSSGAKDYEATSNGTKYALNVCRGVLTELSHVEEPGKVGAFFERPDGKGHFSIG
jgi:cation-dependent mannose-6-phosphate receptor